MTPGSGALPGQGGHRRPWEGALGAGTLLSLEPGQCAGGGGGCITALGHSGCCCLGPMSGRLGTGRSRCLSGAGVYLPGYPLFLELQMCLLLCSGD